MAVNSMGKPENLIQAALDLQPLLRDRSREFETARRIPSDVSGILAQSGFYRMLIPECYGGLETPLPVATRVFEILAEADGSAAWVAFIGATTGTTLALLPAEGARSLFPDPLTLLTGVFAPSGQAHRVPGGFEVSGQWQWGSGSENADSVAGGCIVYSGDEPEKLPNGAPRQHMMFMPSSKIEYLDTWRTSGLCGTGSTHYRAEGVFVPEMHAVGYLQARPLERPLYKFPQFSLLALGIAAVTLGIARTALDTLTILSSGKHPGGSSRKLAERPATQVDIAKAEAVLRSGRSYFYQTLERSWENVLRGEKLSIESRRDLRLATTHAVQSCVDVVDRMYNLGGGSSVYLENKLQQCFRDVHVATQHIMVAPSTLETLGRLFLGLETNTSLL